MAKQQSNTLQTGAPAVLDVASKWEAHAREEVERLESELAENQARQLDPANDGDADLIKRGQILNNHLADALKRWKTFADMVHKFDRSVDPVKRSAEESITREEGSQFVRLFVIYMRTGVERLKENIVPRIRESATNEDGFLVVDLTLSAEFRSAMRSAVENQSKEGFGGLPQWAEDAVESAL